MKLRLDVWRLFQLDVGRCASALKNAVKIANPTHYTCVAYGNEMEIKITDCAFFI